MVSRSLSFPAIDLYTVSRARSVVLDRLSSTPPAPFVLGPFGHACIDQTADSSQPFLRIASEDDNNQSWLFSIDTLHILPSFHLQPVDALLERLEAAEEDGVDNATPKHAHPEASIRSNTGEADGRAVSLACTNRE